MAQRKKKTTAKVLAEKSVQERSRHRESKYQYIYDAVAKLKPGKVVTVAVPKHLDITTFQNRLTSAMAQCPHRPPTGYRYSRFITSSGEIGIRLKRKKR